MVVCCGRPRCRWPFDAQEEELGEIVHSFEEGVEKFGESRLTPIRGSERGALPRPCTRGFRHPVPSMRS